MENIKQSLLILNFLSEAIVEQVNRLYYNPSIFNVPNRNYDEYLSSLHMVIIRTSSYMEEYDGQLGIHTENIYKERINMIKKICSPFLKAIRQWKDLKDYRNQIAHILRKKDGTFVLLDTEYNLHKTPSNMLELLFLRNCILQTQRIIKDEFKSELLIAINELDKIVYETTTSKLKPENFHYEYHKVVCESMVIAVNYNKRINYDIEQGWASV